MLVLDRLMRMVMGMPFGQMQPDPERHQQSGEDELRRDRLMDEGDRDDRAKERGEREISASPSAAEMTQRQHKQHETQADAAESDDERRACRGRRRQARPEKQREREIHASSRHALDERDDDRVRR